MRPLRLHARAVAMLAAALASGTADAHLDSTGMGPLYDGLMHFLTSPEDWVPVLALALLAGLRGASFGRRVMFTLPAAWLLGSMVGLSVATVSAGMPGSAFWFVALGGLVLADAKLSLRVMTALGAVLGLVHGFFNGSGMGVSIPAVVALVGLVSAVFILVALVAGLVAQLQARWARIAVRVAGSWIAASGLLMLGWSLRGA